MSNREEWSGNYAFIPTCYINTKAVCLLCNEVVTVCKETNIRQCHKMKHNAFLFQTEARKRKTEALTESYVHSSNILVRGLAAQKKATGASLKLCDLPTHK